MRASPSRTRGRCFPIRRACCASSPIQRARSDLVGLRLQRHRGLGGKAGDEPGKLNPQEGGDRRALPHPQAAQIRAFRAAWKEAGHKREPRVSVSRSIFALVDDRDRAYFGRGGEEKDQVGFIDEETRAIFGRSYAAEPDLLVKQLKTDEAVAEADTLLLTVPNQLRRRLQRACHRGDPESRRPVARLALTQFLPRVGIARDLFAPAIAVGSNPLSSATTLPARRERRGRVSHPFLHGCIGFPIRDRFQEFDGISRECPQAADDKGFEICRPDPLTDGTACRGGGDELA